MMAIYHGVFIFAVGIGPFPGGLLADHFGLAAPFHAYGAVGLLVSVLAWLAVGETRQLSHPRGGRGWTRAPTLVTQLRLLAAQVGFVLVCLVGMVNAVVRTGGLFNIIPVLGSVGWACRWPRSAADSPSGVSPACRSPIRRGCWWTVSGARR